MDIFRHHLLPNSQTEAPEQQGYLLQCPWGDDQAIDHVDGNEDDGGGSYAVTHNCGPVGIIIIKKPQLRRVGQKAASDKLKEKKGRVDFDDTHFGQLHVPA